MSSAATSIEESLDDAEDDDDAGDCDSRLAQRAVVSFYALPDASPCDYGLFGPMKRPMKGKTFRNEDEVREAVKDSLKNISVIHYDRWIKALPSRYENIVISRGDYF